MCNGLISQYSVAMVAGATEIKTSIPRHLNSAILIAITWLRPNCWKSPYGKKPTCRCRGSS